MPLTDRKQARESGFAQIREAMLSFEGDVVSAEFGQWGGKLIDEDGKPVPPKEFLEIQCVNVQVLEVSEELAFIPDEWNFRVNCSDYKGSFWVEDFLASADEAKLLIPDDLIGKRIIWKKATRIYNIRGREVSVANYIIGSVKAVPKAAPKITPKTGAAAVVAPEEAVEEAVRQIEDPMELALELAVGKTETQFRSAVSLHPSFIGSPLLPLAKAGAITQALVKEGRLIEVQEGNKTIYQRPE